VAANELIGSELAGYRIERELGPHELKDFERPIRLYELVSV
jgi:hypothetical protein